MTHNQNLQNYLSSLQSDSMYSGMDGDEGEITIGYDGNSMGGGVQATSQPYILSITNSSSVSTVTAIVFGYVDYSAASNYGSPAAVTITNSQGGTYARLLVQSNTKPFNIAKFKFISTNTTQLTQTITVFHVNANGDLFSSPMTLAAENSMFRQDTTILDVTRNVLIDANTYLSIPILASATLTIVMYPTEISSISAPIMGGSITKGYAAPSALSASGTNVVIKTTAPVRR